MEIFLKLLWHLFIAFCVGTTLCHYYHFFKLNTPKKHNFSRVPKDYNVKDFIVKQETVKPLIFIGRYLVSKPESENIPEDIIYKCAFKNLMESTDLMQHLHKEKTELQDNDHFFHEYPKIAYEVQLTIVPKQESQS